MGSGRAPLLGETPVDGLPDQARSIGAIEGVDGDNPGRRGDVDFRQPLSADHVDSSKEQPALPELGSECGADFLLAGGQLRLRGLASDGKVGANLAFAREAVDRARYLSVD